MRLKSLEIAGFKSFAKKENLDFESSICAIVGPNGSGKSNVAESFRFVLGEQSMKSMRGKKGEDLIFNGNRDVGRQNKASVEVTFDNTDKLLKVDFDEVELQRVVHRDGVNEYFMNGSKVRLKDIHEVLASANIGASGHHIISQGEADRILNTSVKERRQMLEDALGLRVFEYKKNEALRKLDRTKENIKEVESLRREIAPHLKFLKKQVEKVERVNELREELKETYVNYLSREEYYLTHKERELEDSLRAPESGLQQIEKQLDVIREGEEKKEKGEANELIRLKEEQSDLNRQKFELAEKISGIEGQIKSLSDLIREEESKATDSVLVSRDELTEVQNDVQGFRAQVEAEHDVSRIKMIFNNLFAKLDGLFSRFDRKGTTNFIENSKTKIENLKKEQEVLRGEIATQEGKLGTVNTNIQREEANKEVPRDQMEIIDLMNTKNKLEMDVQKLRTELRQIVDDREDLKREISEAMVLCSRSVLDYESVGVDVGIMKEERSVQKGKRKDLERMKIRLEEMGLGSTEDIMKEFEETSERDKFLASEIEDLKNSSKSLEDLIKDLEEEIAKRFKSGLDKINKEFTKFFALMFGGGEAALKLVKEEVRGEIEGEETFEEGVDIHVNLPRKKIRGLMMLSGGERALTSIALLFAMSAVNPPPFIILDETDAALDEANSKKYGDMIEGLAKHSQLILITHNRETMSRAGTIYGVTMTQGVSQVLSIKFDEAVEVAK